MNTKTYLSSDRRFRSDVHEAVAAYDNPSTSYWLREQIRFCFNTDVCDRLADLEFLTNLLKKRFASIYSESLASIKSSKPAGNETAQSR